MKENEHERIEQLLKKTLPPVSNRAAPELQHDLWPAMLKRLDARPTAVPWFDWALLAALLLWFTFSPGAIPVLLYHL